MICRYYKNGTELDVAGLNQITVLIDRSETELTEVALNSWWPGLDGPPHLHEQKEQIFYVVAGQGTVKIGEGTFDANPGDFFYIPAGVIHQTINHGRESLAYLLFNAFLNKDKEGHASFAEHIEKVKATRKLQARTQRAEATTGAVPATSRRKGKCVPSILRPPGTEPAARSTLSLLPRAEAQRCEASRIDCPPRQPYPPQMFGNKERTLFVLTGTGLVTVGAETEPVKPGDVIFVPRRAPHVLGADSVAVTCLALDTILD